MESPRIFISVAEQSADEHAAALIRAFRERVPEARFVGLAGPAMRDAGCECFHDMTSRSAMALATIGRIPEAWSVLRRLKKLLTTEHFDAAVMVDSPVLNLAVAKLFRRAGVPVLYYIAPQTWAWGSRKRRNAKIKKRVDRLACIWPMEVDFFRQDGIPAVYVGHPSFDGLLANPVDPVRVEQLRASASPVVTLLPGSRAHVVREVLPGQLEVARSLLLRFPKSRFLAVAASDEIGGLIEQIAVQANRPPVIQMVAGAADRGAAIRAADLALVASGTATLEVAYHATPMIVMYNTNRWFYHMVGRWLITTPYFSIPNILAGRAIVPEFMPYYRSADPIIARAIEWLATPPTLQRVRRELTELMRPIIKPGAAANTAAELAGLLEAGVRRRDAGDSNSHPA